MTIWEAAVLGIVQGATEFLPVSSSGHLVMGQAVLGAEATGLVFEVAVHVATLLSILVVYRTRVAQLASGLVSRDAEALRYVGLLLVASVPAACVGLLAGDVVAALFERPAVAGGALLVTGALLWTSKAALAGATKPVPGWTAALLIGAAQAFALVPGVSRSGVTVVTALWLGIEAREAAAFSFLMAVPAIGGAALLELPELGALGGPSVGALLAGGALAAVTGVLAIKSFVAVLGRRAFHLFAPYCWVVGALFLTYLGLR